MFARLLFSLTTLVISSGCSRSGGSPQVIPLYPPVVDPGWYSALETASGALAYGLTEFSSCESVTDYLKARAIKQVNGPLAEMRANAVAGNYSQPQYRYSGVGAGQQSAPAPADSAAPAAQEVSAPNDFSDTNNQVEGVQEADIVKTTGTHLFKISGPQVDVIKTWPTESLELVAFIRLSALPSLGVEPVPEQPFLPEWGFREVVPQALLLYRETNKLVILARDSATYALRCGASRCGGIDTATRVVVVDVSTPAAPVVEREVLVPGWFHTARMIEGQLRVVMNSWTPWIEGLQQWPRTLDGVASGGVASAPDMAVASPAVSLTSSRSINRGHIIAEIDQMMAENARLIKAKPLEFWLPLAFERRADALDEVVQTDCRNVFRPNHMAEWGLTRIATLNLDDGNIHLAALLAAVGEHYSSKQGMYLSTTRWNWEPGADSQQETFVHRFDISDPNTIGYDGSGSFEGYPRNQFSFDEYNGHLRVAHTITNRKVDESGMVTQESRNRVSVMKFADGDGRIVGRTDDFDPGMRIQGVRFMGDRGFVVTFENFDPLRTLDLSDPANPRLVGRLELPGFSTYLQEIDDGLLLAVGFHIEENVWERKLKISLFDVSDFANPQEVDRILLAQDEYSEASWDHHAVTYFAARQVVGVPVSSWVSGRSQSKLKVFSVDLENRKLALRGDLVLSDISVQQQQCGYSWARSARVSRSIFADDYVYAVADVAVASAKVAQPGNRLSLVKTLEASPDMNTCHFVY